MRNIKSDTKCRKLSRRAFLRGLAACAAAGALAGCGAATESRAESASESESESALELQAEPFLTEEEYPIVDGSTACIPLMAQMMAAATGLDVETAQSGIDVSTTAYAWERMGVWNDEDCKLLLVYEAPDYVQEELAASSQLLEKKAIGRDALVFIVNDANPIQSLTKDQLRAIYAGEVTNWSELGGEDAAIVAFQREEDSGSQTLFKKLLIGDGTLMPAPTELAPADMGGLIDSVAEYNGSANAIGFSVYYYVSEMYTKPGLRLLAVDDVLPSNETIGDGSYPLCNEFYAVIRADAAADSPERQLYDWLDTAAGQACIAQAGYVAAQ
jgi:phosphate transport system substrate-binding protein